MLTLRLEGTRSTHYTALNLTCKKRHQRFRDACSTADCSPLLSIVCPLLSIVVHCCPLLSIVVHCCPLLANFPSVPKIYVINISTHGAPNKNFGCVIGSKSNLKWFAAVNITSSVAVQKLCAVICTSCIQNDLNNQIISCIEYLCFQKNVLSSLFEANLMKP